MNFVKKNQRSIKYSIGVCRFKSSVFLKINPYMVLTICQELYILSDLFNHHSNLVRKYSHFPYFTDEETGIERSNSFPKVPQLKPQANIFKIHEVLQERGEGIQTFWVSDVLSYPAHSEQKPPYSYWTSA